MSLSSFFTWAPVVFCFLHISPIIFSLLSPPLPCPIAGRPAGWRKPVQLRLPGHVGLPAHRKSSADPPNLALPPLEASTRRFSSDAGAAGAKVSPTDASKAATLSVLPLVKPSLAARAQATTPPLEHIKAPPEAPKLIAPNPSSGESPPTRGHTTPPPHYPNQHFHHLLGLTLRLHNRSPHHLPHRTVATTILTWRRLCATLGKPPRSTRSPPKTSNWCNLFPSCISCLHPSPSATLVPGFWPAVAVPLCIGSFFFDFNLSEKLSVKSQGSIYKPGTRILKTNLLTLYMQSNSQKNPKKIN
jgi:hypothetical protein